MSAELTLGAEEELHLIDLESGNLSARAPHLLSRLPKESYSAEIQRTTVETNTEVVTTLDGLRDELVRLRRGLSEVASREGLGIAAVGTAPRSAYSDFELTTTGRYGRMQEQYRLLVDEQLICGLQIHVGVSDRDLGVEIMQRVSRDLPVMLALSASSPYWNGQDTGYSSIRSIIWQRWPSAGSTGTLASAEEYEELVSDLITSGVIADAKMAYFDVRPSSHEPTLELRVSDACPLVDDAVLIAGIFRASVRAAELDIEEGRPNTPIREPIHRAAMWQAARGGLSGRLLEGVSHPNPVPAATAVRDLIARLRPQLEQLDDFEQVSALAEATLARGNSADRQRAAFAERGRLEDVVELVTRETRGALSGKVPTTSALTSYRYRAGDEAVGPGSVPRPAYQAIIDTQRSRGREALIERHEARDRWTREAGMTFGSTEGARAFEVDLVPRIINGYEWRELSAGLVQRARAIEAFLEDIYTDRRVLDEGFAPAEHVLGSPGWRDEAARLPRGTIRAPIMGFDLVRNEFGGWRVLEDNVRNPSGMGYGLAIRALMDAVEPDLPRPSGLLDPSSVGSALHTALLGRFGAHARGALLSSGPSSSAWFEHQLLAQEAGLLLVVADDLDVAHGQVIQRRSPEVIDALYLRLDDELVDVMDSDGRAIGAEIMEVAVGGRVFLANAPGNGIADDKAMYCYIPELIMFYLDEKPLLESVPTYRTDDELERQAVLERVGELVTKPVDGYGGHGVLIGPSSTAAEVAERRREIAADPSGWVAQEVVALSSHPTFSGDALQPRHVDLRAFVTVNGPDPADYRLSDVALTRVAPAGSLIVNSSQGGGAKDTWIVADT